MELSPGWVGWVVGVKSKYVPFKVTSFRILSN